MKRAEHRPAPSQQFRCARNSAPAHSHGLLQAVGLGVASRPSALMSRPPIDSQLCGMVRQSRPKIFELEPSITLLVCPHGCKTPSRSLSYIQLPRLKARWKDHRCVEPERGRAHMSTTLHIHTCAPKASWRSYSKESAMLSKQQKCTKLGTQTDSWVRHFKAANKVNSLKGPQLTSSRSLVNI